MANPADILGGAVEPKEARRPTDASISTEAVPPIMLKETERAPHAVCPWHGGLVKQFPQTAKHGAVYFCPIGQQFWRFIDPNSPDTNRFGKRIKWGPPINYNRRGIV